MNARAKARGAFSLPKRPSGPTPDAAAVDHVAAAIAGEPQAPPAPPELGDEPTEGKAGGYTRRKGKGERVTLYLDPKVKRKAELRCARDRRSLSDVVEAALVEWLKTTRTP